MFCLEVVKSNEQAFNPIGCQCHFISHGSCLHSWFEQKHQYECPICHAVCLISPIQPPVIVYIDRERQPERSDISRRQKQCMSICCLGVLFWALFMTVIEYVKNN